jgi:hypothetical protein
MAWFVVGWGSQAGRQIVLVAGYAAGAHPSVAYSYCCLSFFSLSPEPREQVPQRFIQGHAAILLPIYVAVHDLSIQMKEGYGNGGMSV